MVINATEMSVRYGRAGAPQVNALSVVVGSGVTALVGKNGAGKSTFMKAVMGLVPVNAGELDVLGVRVPKGGLPLAVRQRVGYLPQDFGFVSSFTTREFVEYGAWLKRVPGKSIHASATEALAKVGLANESSVKVRRLSGGMRRRAGIAQSIVHDPELLVLDEPTSGLDPEQRVRFRELVRDIARDRAVLLSTHLVEDVAAVASQVLVLDGGVLKFSGAVTELATLGGTEGPGDTALERGYINVVHAK